MTPEQENELVARWIGWHHGFVGDEHGGAVLWRSPSKVWVGESCPNYRTDPALLWELMERLAEIGLRLAGVANGYYFFNRWSGVFTPDAPTLSEAVFAAAVIQAQEGK